MKSLNDRPEVGKTVTVYYNHDVNGQTKRSSYRGRWNGTEWQMRKPYSKDEFEPVPTNITLIGWEELI